MRVLDTNNFIIYCDVCVCVCIHLVVCNLLSWKIFSFIQSSARLINNLLTLSNVCFYIGAPLIILLFALISM